ncbi:MAG: DUF501 domain-containing protein [Actinomycetota bacterium]
MGELRESDLSKVREQLGREPTTSFTVAARCSEDHPLVIRNEPLDADGKPFPTLFWLTCPDAVRKVSRIEAAGAIAELNERAERDPEFANALEQAHQEYAGERARPYPEAEARGGVGGTQRGVKCLHAHYANHLAGGRDPVGDWVASKVEPIHRERDGRAAAIDLGTNSIRLLVVEPRNGEPVELARDMVITRIGKGVDQTGRIDPEALRRTVEVLERYCRRARALHAERIRVAATSAVRDAANREELQEAVLRNTGSELEILTGEEEAVLSFLGATRGLDRPGPYLVVDIGGGSTEFVLGTGEPESAVSTQMGSVRLSERFVGTDPPSEHDLEAMSREIERTLGEAESSVRVSDARTLITVAGTATTVKGIALGLARYDPEAVHRTELSLTEAERVREALVSMTTSERGALPVMPPGREDVIVAGATILVAVMRRWGFGSALVSEEDILDGLAAELLRSR